MSDYRSDRKTLDLVGFAASATLAITRGDAGTVVIEQRGGFAEVVEARGRELRFSTPAERYVCIAGKHVPELIKQLRALTRRAA